MNEIASDVVSKIEGRAVLPPKFDGPSLISDWLTRDIPPTDPLMGAVFTTTTRTMLAAGTGVGKTLITLPQAISMSAGQDFLHWKAHRPCRVIFIDGEMPRSLMKERIAEAIEQTDCHPEGLSIVSHEDIENFPPLNTPAGQAFMDGLIEDLGGADFLFLDNMMSLLSGDPRDTDSWRDTLPWVNSLTQRNIGQLWLHHAGHNADRFYGDSTRSWRMDSVIHLTSADHADADVCVDLEFKKSRNKTPATADDFAPGRVTLSGNKWQWQSVNPSSRVGHISPKAVAFLDALTDALAAYPQPYHGRPCVTPEQWRSECVRKGLIDADKTASARSQFSRYRTDLVTAHRVACDGNYVWKIQPDG